MSNPPSIGGAGAAVAISILNGETVDKITHLTPEAWSSTSDLEDIYVEDLAAGWSSYMEIEPYTHYTSADVVACLGPGE